MRTYMNQEEAQDVANRIWQDIDEEVTSKCEWLVVDIVEECSTYYVVVTSESRHMGKGYIELLHEIASRYDNDTCGYGIEEGVGIGKQGKLEWHFNVDFFNGDDEDYYFAGNEFYND